MLPRTRSVWRRDSQPNASDETGAVHSRDEPVPYGFLPFQQKDRTIKPWDQTPRTANPALFANASRFHTGGVAGLRPDEVPIIAQRGEEILTRDDPRHRANGGLGGGARMPDIKVVKAIDAGDFVSKGLSTTVGEKAIMNFIRANRGAVKAIVG